MNIKRLTINFIAFSTFTIFFIACGNSNNNPVDSGNNNTSAALIISISSPVVTPLVKVTGKNKNYNLSSTDTLKGIDPGTYTIISSHVDQSASSGELVGKSYGVLNPVRQVIIKAGETQSINIDYVVLPGSGKLWVSDDNGSRMLAFDKTVLTAPGSPAPSVKIQFNFEGPRGFAFDKMGNLWVAGFSKSHVFAFSPGQLSGNTSANPIITISNNSIHGPNGLIFDASGNLWISNWSTGNIVAYKSDSLLDMLVKTGNITAEPGIQITSTALKKPDYMTFDGAGNLWIAGQNPSTNDGEIIKILSTDLNSSGEVSPSIVISESSQPTLINVTSLAFDKNGNLWGTDGNSFFRFTANQLTVSGATVPQLYRGVPAPALLTGLVFDSQANLWIGETYTPRLIRYTYPDNGYGTTYNTSSALDEPTWLVFFPSINGYSIN